MPKSRRSRKSRKTGGKTYLPQPERGEMDSYSTYQSASTRRRELAQQVREKSYSTVVHELSLRATMTKNRSPSASKTMKSDMKYLQEHRDAIESAGRKSRSSRKSGGRRSRRSRKSRR